MPLSAVETGDRTELWLDVGEGLVEVAEIVDLPELPSGSRGTYKTTHMKSGSFEEFKKLTRKEGNTFTITGNAILGSAANTTLKAADDADDAIEYRIATYQGADVYHVEGAALFMNYKVTNPADDRRMFEISMQPVDEPTVAEAP